MFTDDSTDPNDNCNSKIFSIQRAEFGKGNNQQPVPPLANKRIFNILFLEAQGHRLGASHILYLAISLAIVLN